MNDLARLDALHARWLDLREQGGTPSLTEVCRDCPELIDAFAKRLRKAKRLAALLGADSPEPATKDLASTADEHPAACSSAFPFLEPPDSAEYLGRLGPYRILEVLGEGGMGIVFKAEEQQPRRLVALKVMKPERASAQARQRFLREGQSLATVEHERVVSVFRVDEVGGVPFLVMPLLKGESLEARLKRDRQLSMTEVLRIGREVAEGLAAAHATGLIHRDIKPSNIWLREPDSRVLLLDFGLARPETVEEGLTNPGVAVGTPAYMAPEQASGEDVDSRADLFSLGCVLYRLCTGNVPFAGSNSLQILQKLAIHQPLPPHQGNPKVPVELSELVMQLLEKERERRPGTANEVVRRLHAVEVAGPTATYVGRPSQAVPSSRTAWEGRPTRMMWLAAGIGVAVLVGLAVVWLGRNPAQPTDLAQVPVAPFKGAIDLRVWEKGNATGPGLRLHQAGALPLHAGDLMRVEVELNRPGYVYVVWLDSRGETTPLYPWRKADWSNWPEDEQPHLSLALPQGPDTSAAPLGESPSGVETLLLMVRSEPWPRAEDMGRLFEGMPAQKGLTDKQARAWFEDGQLVRNERDRGAVKLGQAEAVDDPVMRMQALLRGRLQKVSDYTRAVSFAFEGK